MTPDLQLTEACAQAVIPATRESDELADLLLYVWLRSEVNDDWDLPLARKAPQ